MTPLYAKSTMERELGRNIHTAVGCLLSATALPPDIVNAVAQYITVKDLLNVNTVCSSVQVSAEATIYYSVTFEFTGSNDDDRLVSRLLLFYRTLLTNPAAASAVKRLSLMGDPLHSWRHAHWNPHTREAGLPTILPSPNCSALDVGIFNEHELLLHHNTLTDHADRATSASGVGDLGQLSGLGDLSHLALRRVSHLRYLRIDSDFFRYPSFAHALREYVQCGHLEHLEDTDFCMDLMQLDEGKAKSIYATRGRDDALLTPLLAPNIVSASTAMSLAPETFRMLFASSIQKLILHHCQWTESHLDSLLARTPQLRHLEYHDYLDYGCISSPTQQRQPGFQCYDLAPLTRALQRVRSKLEYLTITQQFVEDSPHFSPGPESFWNRQFRQDDGLSKMHNLRTLEIPFPLLIGWEASQHQLKSWDEMLPGSLRRLTWTDHLTETFHFGDWDDESLMPVVTDLLDWLTRHHGGEQDIHFNLSLVLSDYDWHVAEREALGRLCAERNIFFSCHKMHSDLPKPPREPHMPRGRGMGRGRVRGQGRGRGGA